MINIEKEINEGSGYLYLPKIESEILNLISSSIDNSLKELIDSKNIIYKNKGNFSIMDSYKYISNSQWISLFNKKSRTLKKECTLPISKYFSNYLESLLECKIEISDDLLLGFPCLSFRIVRPLQKNDIGPLHADQWFIDIGVQPNRTPKIKSELIKFWMPVEVESNTSNLLLIPNSHKDKEKYKYEIEETQNGLKPIINKNINREETIMINNENGCPVIFNMNLIHGGALNKSNKCRVSLEFEFFASK